MNVHRLLALAAPAAFAGAVPADAAAEVGPASGIASLLQTGLGLAAIVALILGCAWAARRLGLQHHGNGHLIKVIASTAIGQRERVIIVEVGASWLVLGVAAGHIRTLHTMPAERAPKLEAAAAAPGTFSQKLQGCLASFRRPG